MEIVAGAFESHYFSLREEVLEDRIFVLYRLLPVQEEGRALVLFLDVEASELLEVRNESVDVNAPLDVLVVCRLVVDHVAGY